MSGLAISEEEMPNVVECLLWLACQMDPHQCKGLI